MKEEQVQVKDQIKNLSHDKVGAVLVVGVLRFT